MKKLTNLDGIVGITNDKTLEYKSPEWVFQFNNDEPITLTNLFEPGYE